MSGVATKVIGGEVYNNTGAIGKTKSSIAKEVAAIKKRSGRKVVIVKETTKAWGTLYRAWIKKP